MPFGFCNFPGTFQQVQRTNVTAYWLLLLQVPQYILDDYIETCHGAECCITVTQVSHNTD